MAGIEVKRFDSPEEVRVFVDKGEARIVRLGEKTVMKNIYQPGWHWKNHIGAFAGTGSCQSPHLLYVLSGGLAIRMDDGTEKEVRADEVVRIEPGHDAWTLGDVPCVTVDFGIAPTYARRD